MACVLIVDDELGIRETFQAVLEDEGYDVTTAANFFEAESFLSEHPCDIVVADIILPRVNGLALLQRVCEIDASIPVIMITGEPDVATAAEAVRHGAYDYIAKPVTLDVLTRVVGRAVERKQLLDEKRRLEAENLAYQVDLERRVAERTAELTTLIEISRDVSATLVSTKVLKRVTRRAAQVCKVHRCTILLLAEDGKMVIPLMSQFSDGRKDREMWRLFKNASYLMPVSQVSEAQRVIRERRPFFIPDAPASSLPRSLIESFGIESVLLVPLISKEQVIGLMVLDHIERGQEFTSKQIDLAMGIAAQAAVAIENARLFEAERAQLLLARTLQKVGALLTTRLSLDEVYQHIFDLLSQVVKYQSVSIQLVDADGQLSLLVERGFPDPERSRQVVRELGSLTLERFVEREVIVIPDTHNDSRWVAAPGVEYIRSWIGAPLLVKGKLIGILNVDSATVNAYDAAAGETVMAFANQAAIAIENARLFEEIREHVTRLEKKTRDMELIHQVSRAISSSLDLTRIMELTTEQMVAVFEADHSGILLFDPAQTYGQVVTEYPSTGATAERYPVQGYLAAERIIAGREPLVIEDVWNDPLMATVREAMHRLDIRSMLIVPLIVKEEVVGSIGLDAVGQQRRFSTDEVALAQTIANQVAIAIENARLYEETKRRAEEMTTLYHTSMEIGMPTALPDLLWTICDRAAKLLNVDKGGLYLYDEVREELELVVSYKLSRDLTGTRIKLGEGVAGRVVQTGQSLTVDDYSHWEERALAYEGEPFTTVIGVPLRWQERIIGAIILSEETEQRTFTSDDERLLGLFAQQAAVAIENARLLQETNRRLNDLSFLHDIALVSAATLDFDQIMHRTVESVRSELQLDVFGFLLIDEEADVAHLHPAFLGLSGKLADFSIPLGEGITGWVAQTGQPLLASDVSQEPRYRDIIPGIRSEVCVPLRVGGKIIGVIDAESAQPDAFSEEHVQLFSTLAAQLGVVLENARLFEEIRRRLAEAELIQEVVLAAASTLDFDLVLERAVKALNRALGVYCLGFLLPDEQRGVLMPHPSLVGFAEMIFQIPIKGSLVGQVYRTGRPILVRDMAQETAYQEVAPDVRSELAVPVWISGRIVAVLYTQSPQVGAFDEDELRLFTTIAGQLGMALENARLYQRLETQTAELSRAYTELQEVNRLRAELVQNVGHELRTPLTLIKGYVELLRDGDLGPILNNQRLALQIVHERTVTLSRLIHNLTMMRDLPREALSLAPVSLVEVAQHALAKFRALAKEAGIAFSEDLPGELPPVMGNQEHLELACGHLLDNAIKFSPDGGTVTLRAWAEEDVVCLSIADEGIGISSEHLDRVFECFYQVDGSASRRFGGMGVGLALVWEIIKAHGGTVKVKSNVGEGSRFTIALPQNS